MSGFPRLAVFVGLVPAVPAGNTPTALEEAEREQILANLQKTNWVVASPDGAAARLGPEAIDSAVAHARARHSRHPKPVALSPERQQSSLASAAGSGKGLTIRFVRCL